jgi:hypothetical protein
MYLYTHTQTHKHTPKEVRRRALAGAEGGEEVRR